MDYDYINNIDIVYDYLYLNYKYNLLYSSRLYISITTISKEVYIGLFVLEGGYYNIIYSIPPISCICYMGLFVCKGGYGVKWAADTRGCHPSPGHFNAVKRRNLFVKLRFSA